MDKIIHINVLSTEQKQQILLNLLENHCFFQAFNILLDNGITFNYEILLRNDVSQAIIILAMNGKGSIKENLEEFILQPDEYAKAVMTLNEQGLLNRGYFLDIKNAYKQQQNISELAEAYVYLDKHHLLNFSNCQALLKNKRPNDVAEAFAVCDRNGLFIGAAEAKNREVVACHESPYSLALGLSSLNRLNLLSGRYGDQNRAAIAEHPCPLSIDYGSLRYRKLLENDIKQDVFDAIIRSPQPKSIVESLCLLKDKGMLESESDDTKDFLKILSKSSDPIDASYAIMRLKENNLLHANYSWLYFKAVSEHKSPGYLAIIIVHLHNTSLFKPGFIISNIEALAKHPNLLYLVAPFHRFDEFNLLREEIAQINFDKLLNCHEIENFSYIFRIMSRYNFLTPDCAQDVFDNLIERPSLEAIHNAVKILEKSKFSNKDAGEFFKIISDPNFMNPQAFMQGISILYWDDYHRQDCKLYSRANLERLKTHPNPISFAIAVTKLNAKDLLSDEQGVRNMEILMESPEPEVVANSIINRTFDASNPSRFFGVVSPEEQSLSTNNESHQPNI